MTMRTGFPLYFGIEIQGFFKDPDSLNLHFQGPIFTHVCSTDSITAIFNIYFCDYRTAL